jgi:hypothetical protein
MYKELFNGYNCLSAALGEYSIRKKYNYITDVINSQLTFIFDEKPFWDDEWFAGSTLEPLDKYLLNDLIKYQCGNLYQEKMTLDREIEYLKKNDLLIVLVDFYYMKSVDWKLLKRFNILPEHDPHFILVESIDTFNNRVSIIDPYYNYVGKMELDRYVLARSGDTRQGKVENIAYLVSFPAKSNCYDIKSLFYDRIQRYFEEKMFEGIFKMGEEIDKRRLIYGPDQDRKWAINAYNCLRSSMDQHTNLNKFAKNYHIELTEEFEALENMWGQLRKKLIEYYNHRLDDLEEISYATFKIGQIEKEAVTTLLKHR